MEHRMIGWENKWDFVFPFNMCGRNILLLIECQPLCHCVQNSTINIIINNKFFASFPGVMVEFDPRVRQNFLCKKKSVHPELPM